MTVYGSSPNRGTPIYTPKYCNPEYGYPQEGATHLAKLPTLLGVRRGRPTLNSMGIMNVSCEDSAVFVYGQDAAAFGLTCRKYLRRYQRSVME